MATIRDFKIKQQQQLATKKDAIPVFRAVLCDSVGLTTGSGSVWADEAKRLVWYRPIGVTYAAQVRCIRLEPILGMGVLVGVPDGSNEQEVLSDDPFLRENLNGLKPMTVNGRDFEPGGRFQMWLYSKAFVPLATYPGAGLSVTVVEGDYEDYQGVRQSFAGAVNSDISAAQPAGPNEHCLVGIYISSAGAIGSVAGSTVATSATAPEPTWPAGSVPLSVVDLDDTQTTVNFANDISDRRLYFPYPGSGAILKTFLDAKGDLISASADNTPAILSVGTDGYILTADSGETTGLKWAAASSGTAFEVKNTSLVTVAAGDVGYINEDGEFKVFASADQVNNWAVVITGGANNAQITVTKQGVVSVNYSGSAPSAGDYLANSATPGYGKGQTYVSPPIFAVCLAAGSGGAVDALLLCNRTPLSKSSTNDFFRVNSSSDSQFTGTINGAPSGTSVVYSVSTGNEDSIVPVASTQLAKILLNNTTRSSYARISAVDTGTNTITVTAAGDISTWQNGDTIVVDSTTVVASGPPYFFDLEITSTEIPVLAAAVKLDVTIVDAGAAQTFLHPFDTYSSSRGFGASTGTGANTAGVARRTITVEVYNRRLAYLLDASGSATSTVLLRLAGFELAAP